MGGARFTVMPLGKPVTESATAELNVLVAAVVTCKVPLVPAGMLIVVFDNVRVNVDGITTFSVMGRVLVTPPLTAVNVRVRLPGVALAAAVAVNVTEAPGFTVVADRLSVTLLGAPLTLSVPGVL